MEYIRLRTEMGIPPVAVCSPRESSYLDMVAYAIIPVQETETGELQVQGCLGFMLRSCSKQNKQESMCMPEDCGNQKRTLVPLELEFLSVFCYLPWFEVFYKLLNILADYTTKQQESQWNELLETLHRLPIPDPGVSVHLSMHSFFTVPDTRELPSIPENRNLTEYFVAVDVNNMLHLYASMLYERRILLVCSKLST
ncbi:hypothetical protein STEG23_036019, partial [Scotinomys teguina]